MLMQKPAATAADTWRTLSEEPLQASSGGEESQASTAADNKHAPTTAPVDISSTMSGGETASATPSTFPSALFVFGDNSFGKLGTGVYVATQKVRAVVPIEVGRIQNVSAGAHNSLFTTEDGEIFISGAGRSEDKQTTLLTGFSSLTHSLSFTKLKLSQKFYVKSVSLGSYHAVLATTEGRCFSWGYGKDGQLGHGDSESCEAPTEILSLSNVKQVACGSKFSVALCDWGEVLAFGDNSSGQLGCGSTISKFSPTPVKRLKGIKAISCGSSHVLALSEEGSQLWTWGRLNFEGEVKSVAFGPLWADLGFERIASGTYHNVGVTKEGEVYEWKLGEKPTRVAGLLSGKYVREVACGAFHTLALTYHGQVYAWGRNKHGQLGVEEQSPEQTTKAAHTTKKVSVVRVPLETQGHEILSVYPVGLSAGEFHSLVIADCNKYLPDISALVISQRDHAIKLKIVVKSYVPLLHKAVKNAKNSSSKSSSSSSPSKRRSFTRSDSVRKESSRRKSISVSLSEENVATQDSDTDSQGLVDLLNIFPNVYKLHIGMWEKMDRIMRQLPVSEDVLPLRIISTLQESFENVTCLVDLADCYLPALSRIQALRQDDLILDMELKAIRDRVFEEYTVLDSELTDPATLSLLELLLEPFRQVASYVQYLDKMSATMKSSKPSYCTETALDAATTLRRKIVGLLMRLMKHFNLTEPMEILYSTVDSRGVPQLGSGSLRQLVERLSFTSLSVDMEFTNAFFLTMKRFASPDEVVSTLATLWEDSRSKTPATVKRQAQQGIMFALHSWLQHPHSLADWKNVKSSHSDKLSALLDRIVAEDETWETTVKVLRSFVKGDRKRRTLRVSLSYSASSSPSAALADSPSLEKLAPSLAAEAKSAPITLSEFMSNDHNIAQTLAQEIAIADSEIFASISHLEFAVKGAFSGPNAAETAPGITKMTNRFNQIALWTAYSICDPSSSKDRAAVFQVFVDTAATLWSLCELSGFSAIVTGLCNSSISRLTKTMNKVSDKHKNRFAGFCEIISGAQNYRMLRQTWSQAAPPAIPFLALILRDVTFIEDGNPDFLDNGGINFYKWRKLSTVVHDALQFQDSPFLFRRSFPMAQVISRGLATASELGEDGIYSLSKSRE